MFTNCYDSVKQFQVQNWVIDMLQGRAEHSHTPLIITVFFFTEGYILSSKVYCEEKFSSSMIQIDW